MNNNFEESQRKAAQIERFAYPNRLSKEIVFRAFLASLLALIILLILAACDNQSRIASNGTRPENQMNSNAERLLIDPEFAREEIAKHEEYKKLLKARCPRYIIDRIEELRRYHANNVLHSLKYATVTDGTWRGNYVKVTEITSEGRRELGKHIIVEDSEEYHIEVARREFITGSETISKSPKSDDLAFVNFRWRWKAINRLGEYTKVRSRWDNSEEIVGSATFQRVAEGWKLTELKFDESHEPYLYIDLYPL